MSMKKLIIAIVALMLAAQSISVVYAENESFLPEAAGDVVFAVIPSEQSDGQLNETESGAENDIQTVPVETIEPTGTPTPTAKPVEVPQPKTFKANQFTADFTVEGEGFNAEKTAKFALYDGAALLDECEYYVNADTRRFSVTFDVPQYNVGKQFSIVCTEGAEGMRYYDDFYGVGALVAAPTYAYTDETGADVVVTNTAMNLITVKEKKINIYVDGNMLSLKSPPRLVKGTIMVPVREMSEALGVFDVTYNSEYNSVRVAVKDKETLFNIGYPWTTVNGVNRVDSVPTMYIGSSVYVPLATLADGVASTMEQWEHEKYYDVLLSRSKHVINYIDKVNYINSQKLTSKTDYLIWVSKANYEVNVFKNIGGVWNFVNSYKCAIGASSTPTCVGTYRYYEKIARWTYPDFYVGPVMRFNGGYAIHSTLLKYDGTDYNRTVGKKLSHGCVRVQPPDMEWLVNNIPMYTTVHVTDI